MISRRRFITGTLSAGAALAAQGCQQMAAQPAAKRIIVDSQVHLWKAESPDWRWVPGIVPHLPEPFTIEKLLPMMDDAGVDRVIVVPPSWPGDRNDYGVEAAQRYPARFAVMGRINLRNPQSAALLPKWREQSGMLGFRLIFNSAATAPLLSNGSADWFWPAAEKANLPVMCHAPELSQHLARIAERHPQLVLILDNMGLSQSLQSTTGGHTDDLIKHTLSLAKYPNVSVKLSSVANHSHEDYPYRDINVHVRRVFDAYGPRRCHWGSDMTRAFGKATYRQRVTHFTEALDFLSEEDKDWIMGRALLARLNWT
jgi:predicted TIM-barrel fold metal-dependent hydrolase